MGNYIEQYNIPGLSALGIEDHESPGEHFFPHHYKSGETKRFQCWYNGCGIGSKPTLPEAREHCFQYAVQSLKNQIKMHYREFQIRKRALEKLRDDSFNLGLYRSKK
jgi:hypothetical protein